MDDGIETDPRMYMILQHLFISDLKLQQIMNRELMKDGLTVKQFHLLWVVENSGSDPSMNEAAKMLATSHQNVKQIALQLEKKGFLRLEKDPEDKRILRLHLTQAHFNYWRDSSREHDRTIKNLFKGYSDEDIDELLRNLGKVRKQFEDFDPRE